MAIDSSDLFCYGALAVQETDTGITGSGIDTSTKMCWQDLTNTSGTNINGQIGIISNTADTDVIHVWGRNAAGELVDYNYTLNNSGIVYATGTTTWNRLLKATRSAKASNVAVIASGITQSGTSTPVSASVIILSGAVTTDNAYQFQVIRLSGTGQTSLSQITSYVGSTRTANLYPPLSGTLTGAITYYVHEGMLFNGGTPSMITTVRRPFYNASADVTTGATKTYYDKVFMKNTHATLALTTATIALQTDASNYVSIALESGAFATHTGSVSSRLNVTPTNCTTFASGATAVMNSQNHSAGAAQGVWLRLQLPAGAAANNGFIVLRESGQSI